MYHYDLMKRSALFLFVFLLLSLPLAGQKSGSTEPGATAVLATLKAGDTVTDFGFIDFAGKERKFSEFKGKVVLIDFWATWCAPCLADIPKLRKIYDKYSPQGFEILGMNSETIGDEDPDPEFAGEAATRAKQIATTRGAIWTHASAATSLPVAEKVFGVTALPLKVLVGRDGRIIARLGEKDDTEKIVSAAMDPNAEAIKQ